ncbi:MAG: septum site-determining protein MinC [Peptococcaceae bacterium]|jgi:septum site-determining protein MinC|nr:septum site-determining protein MinC [Peptococcaceae bacterium]
MEKDLIKIKGTLHGLVFNFNTDVADFQEICQGLEKKLSDGAQFFAQANYIIDPNAGLDATQIQAIEDIFIRHGLTQGKLPEPTATAPQGKEGTINDLGLEQGTTQYLMKQSGDGVLIPYGIRSGKKIMVEGHAIVMGDINPGAHIIATGNILVMGTLRGIAHAGASGDTEAYIMAYRLAANQLRIADKAARAEDNDQSAGNYPEKAYLKDGMIVIDPYETPQTKRTMIKTAR